MRPAPKRGSLPTALWMLRTGLWPVACYPRAKRPIGAAWASAVALRGAGVGACKPPGAWLAQ